MRTPKLLFLSLAVSSSLYAQDVKVVGTIDTPVNTRQNQTLSANSLPHSIKLLKVELTQPAVNALNKRAAQVSNQSKTLITSSHLPPKVELGMNNVPVLDQGNFGTCVTFASTAAVNAALNAGDYISQLCQLQLGNYLQENGYNSSGWDGSLGRYVLSQMETYGIVSKAQQKAVGCGQLTEYPHNQVPETNITPEEFHQLSENINQQVSWSPILDIFTAMDRTDTTKTVNDIKQALNEHDRVTFGVLLLDFDLGMMGAVGTNHANFDTWVLTPEIARDIFLRPMFGGHEMIITGYDDDAIAIDDQGRQHKGLFTLRNSWGNKIGDKGNFYMSYDYFKVLVIEAQRIRGMADGGVDSVTV